MSRPTRILTTLAAAGMLAACGAAAPTDELVSARRAMNEAESGPAAQYEPEQLREAELVLQRAEEAHDEEPGSQLEEDLAYVAHRKIETVSARARRTAMRQNMEQEREQYTEALEDANQSREERLRATNESLEDVRRDLEERGDVIDEQTEALREREAALEAQQRELMETRQERDEAQEELAEAMTALEEFAELRREQNDLIITLSGSVLFETDEAVLLPAAERRLQAVATALKDRDGGTFVVEGHTDSRASDTYNRRLSRDRAQSVREFLVSQGVDPENIRAVGRGESEPVATNDTPSGRANNRRVEIHVKDPDQRQTSL